LAITIPLVAIAIKLLARDGIRGNFGKSWIFFVAFAVLWFVAERIWSIYELVYRADPWPSEADFFWLAGYPAYFVFTVFYLKPFKNMISFKLIALAFSIATALIAFLVYYTTLQESDLSFFETVLGISYPIFDTISLVPIVIGLVLFFRGQVSFFWSCLMIGMLCFVLADYGYLFLSLDKSYYTGHVIDIPYLWAYLFFLTGVSNYAKIFKKRDQESQFNDQESLQ
jgi:hypothetical protein